MLWKTLISLFLPFAIFKDCEGMQTCCDDGWLPFQGTCYYIGHSGEMTFFAAERFCQKHGADLVIVDNPDEEKFLKNYVLNLAAERDYWIGISDMAREHHWVIYGTNETLRFVDWWPGQPDNSGDEDCAIFSTWPEFHGQWHDVECGSRNVPLCEKTLSVMP